MSKDIWYSKYLPKKISDYIFQDESQKELITKMIEEKNIPHLLLHGHRGTGKTSLAYLIKSELQIDDIDFLKINASDENNVDVVRSKIKNFISSMAMSSEYKLVFLDEADYLSGNAQGILRSMMEEYVDNARFILTCNKPHKIIPELKSRCTEIQYSTLDKDAMTLRFAHILKKEKIKVEDIDIIDEYVDRCYPDFRKLLVVAQGSIKNGSLQPFQDNVTTDTTEHMVTIIDFLEKDNWERARTYLSENISDDKWDECYQFLYTYLHEIGKFKDTKKWKAGVVVIADHLYKNSFVSDPEINFAACLVRLSEI